MRALLKGNPLEDDNLYFIPNLIAAWFISEAARNPSTLAANLMLLDLMESSVHLDDGNGSSWYDWHNTLVHPLKDLEHQQDLKVKNLYGKDILIDDFGGCHPMSHHGSVKQAQQAFPDETQRANFHKKKNKNRSCPERQNRKLNRQFLLKNNR